MKSFGHSKFSLLAVCGLLGTLACLPSCASDEEAAEEPSPELSDNSMNSSNNSGNVEENELADENLGGNNLNEGGDDLGNNSLANGENNELEDVNSNLAGNGGNEDLAGGGLNENMTQVFDPNKGVNEAERTLNTNTNLGGGGNLPPNNAQPPANAPVSANAQSAGSGNVAVNTLPEPAPVNAPPMETLPANAPADETIPVASESGWDVQSGDGPAHIAGPAETATPAVKAKPPWRRELTQEELESYRAAAAKLRDLAPGEGPWEYVIQPGDTLWDISDQFVDDSYWWPKLWSLNPDIPNPHRIYPGMKIMFFPGASPFGPLTQVADLGEVYPISKDSLSVTRMPASEGFQGEEMELLDPATLADDSEVTSEGLMIIPSAIMLMTPGFMASEWPDEVGQIVSVADPSIMGTHGEALIAEMNEDVQAGQKFLAVRESDSGCDPNLDCDTAGLDHFIYTGVVGVSKVGDEGRALLAVEDTRTGVLPGDFLIPFKNIYLSVNPEVMGRKASVEARVVAFGNPRQSLATTLGDVIFLVNDGDGSVSAGDDITLYMPRTGHADFDFEVAGSMPTGRAKVIEVNDDVITAVIVQAFEAITVGARTWSEF